MFLDKYLQKWHNSSDIRENYNYYFSFERNDHYDREEDTV